MDPMNTEALSTAILPNEILYRILEYLPILELMRCRRVCRLWLAAADMLTRRDECWRRLCARDHAAVHAHARAVCRPDLTWRQLYQSLHLWTKVDTAKETWTEIFSSDRVPIATIRFYKDLLVIHGHYEVVYCDKVTLEPKKLIRIGQHDLFRENEHVAAYLSYDWSPMSDLQIVPKSNHELLLENTVTIDDVSNFVIVSKDVYYETSTGDVNKIFVCKCSDNYNSTELITSPLPVWGMSYYEDYLHVMLGGYNVYKLINNIFAHVKDEDNIFGTLKYGFQFKHFNFEAKFDMSIILDINYTISKIFSYDNFIFTGSQDGVLRLHNAELLAKEPKSEPIVKYDISEIFRMAETTICGIDVLERETGHTVYVSTCNKIVAVDLTH